MTQHDDELRLRHMLQYAREAVDFAAGKARDDLDRDRMLNLALVRLIEIIGEAANQVSRERQDCHPEIDWPQVIGMRHRLIHGYDNINFRILWDIITLDLPPSSTHSNASSMRSPHRWSHQAYNSTI